MKNNDRTAQCGHAVGNDDLKVNIYKVVTGQIETLTGTIIYVDWIIVCENCLNQVNGDVQKVTLYQHENVRFRGLKSDRN